jgi:hypothetical protein
LAKNDIDLATQALNHALKIYSDHPKALLLKAQTEMAIDNPNLARLTIQSAKTVVEDPIPFDLLLIEMDHRSNPHGALNTLQNLANEHPENPSVLNQLAV